MDRVTRKIRIVIADDHPIYRDGLRQMLEPDPALQLVHETNNGRTALEEARRLKADVVLLDIDMPQMSGLDVARERQRCQDSFAIIFLTMYREEDLFNEAMDLGVKGYVLKESAAADIRAAVHAVAGGRPYISPSLSEFMLNRASGAQNLRTTRPGLDALTASELRILKLIASDRTSKEIAEDLGLSPRTVENHRTNICAKLDLHGSHALLKFAFENRSKLQP
ncbi:MAG: response regulator transcription factor [Verrucomicrobiales bacterium]|nr:response regulator transcription factor [Verrucomicrobiales bacterium]